MPTKKRTQKKSTNNVKSRHGGKKPLISSKQKEEFKVEGKKVVGKIKTLIREGNVRKITVKDNKGGVILSIPVTAGVIGTILLPPLAILGVLAAMITECTITVVRRK